ICLENIGDLLHAVARRVEHEYECAGSYAVDEVLNVRNAPIDEDDFARSDWHLTYSLHAGRLRARTDSLIFDIFRRAACGTVARAATKVAAKHVERLAMLPFTVAPFRPYGKPVTVGALV